MNKGHDLPLVVDLDGTLLRSDLLMEAGLMFLRDQPHRCLAPLQWMLRGKAALKRELADATEIDVSVLPYDRGVLEFIESERLRGRRVVLATAADSRLAQRVAQHLALFDEVIATEGNRNLSAKVKRDALVSSFGHRGFDYAGNSHDDLPVWGAARQAYVVNASGGIERRARSQGNVAGVFRSERSSLRDWSRAMRLHHWLKNVLIFVPLLTAHRYSEPILLLQAMLAFVCYGLCASSVYVMNDLLDLRDDRHHARKRFRPFASGRLSIQSGLVAFPFLLAAAFGLALWQLPQAFSNVLASYYVLTVGYSLVLKRRMVVDVVALAILYTLRVIAGAAALSIPLSFWLLAFAMFIFMSLALVKRYAELSRMSTKGREEGEVRKAPGRGYFLDDLQMIGSLGTASGYMAVLVLALYVNDPHTAQLYRHQEVIWLACPLLLTWISRVWMMAHRGYMNEDPVVFAVRDRVSLGIGVLIAIVFLAAI
ncbi:MAG TPA: UbiA family prenyltransferase [Burkholderiaceae bacterium]|nr:UbiA family prenyltransferase [Burkholderiaceae bacterium]